MSFSPYSKEYQLRGHQKEKDKPQFKQKRYPQPKKPKKKYTGEKNYRPNLNTRKKFSEETKRKACELFNYRCANCGSSQLDDPHHIRYRSENGKGVLTNCLPVCRPCHNRIHNEPELAMKWKRWAKEQYGHDYWQDEWDKESLKHELYRDVEL